MRPTRLKCFLCLPAIPLALLFTPFCLLGQTSSKPSAPVPAPANQAFTLNAEEVSLDLLVHDRSGRPVLDLQPSEIAVTDDGTPVKITNLHLIRGDQIGGQKITLVFGRLDSAGDKNARDVAAKILKAIPAGVSFSVLNIGGRLRLLQTFTSDRGLIDKAVAMATVEDKPGVDGPSAAAERNLIAAIKTGADANGNPVPVKDLASSKVLLASLQESQRIIQDQGSQPPLAGLLAVARTERDLPGRKLVLYFTEGMQMDSNAVDLVHAIVGAANRSGVTFYAVDLSALNEQASNSMMATMAMGSASPGLNAGARAATNPGQGAGASPSGPGMSVSGAEQAGRFESDHGAGNGSPLGALAAGTGGTYIVGGDSLKKPLKALVDDMSSYYEASFVPAITDYDGSFRPVHVTARRKNIVLHYRAGYFALAPGSASGVRPFEASMLKMLSGAQLPNDIPFRAEVLRMGNLQDGNANTLVIEVPVDELDVREDANTNLYSLHVSMVAQIKSKDGVVIDHFSEDVPRHGAIESLQGSRADVVTMQRHFIAPPGDYVLEAAILDQNNQKGAAQRVSFQVPTAPAGLALSDMALVRGTDLFRTEADPLEPLRYGKARVVPNLSGEVPKGAKDVSVFFIIHPDAGAAPIKLEMEVLKNGKSIGKMPLPVRSDAGAGGAIPYLGTIQAHSLSSGHYKIAAVLTQGDRSAQRTVDFTIAGGEVASADIPRSGVKPGAAAEAEPVSDSQLPGIGAREASHLVITSPAEAVAPPKPEEIVAIITGVRARALHYSESLPNFSCVEVTTRSIDAAGRGQWKHKDAMAELLRYSDQQETRTMLEVDGRRSSVAPGDLKGMSSRGQFGGVLNAVFDPTSKAEFQWKETDMLGTGLAQVLTYKVAQKNSNYGLTGNNLNQINVAFHGLVYIDANTLGVRRITLEADDIPRDFSIHASTMAVDYDYIVINKHDYLMPVHAVVSIRQGKHEGVLNELEFRDYRRFGSKVRILGFTQPPTP